MVSGISTTADTALNVVGTAVNGLGTSALPGLTSGVSGLLSGLLGFLGLGEVKLNLSATFDLQPVRNLLTQPFNDTAGILNIDLGAGTVSVDLAGLLATAYPGQYGTGLNGLAPNTELLINAPVIVALQAALTQALQDWLTNLLVVLRGQLDAIVIDATVLIDVTAVLVVLRVPVAEITVGVKGTLAELLDNTATITAPTFEVLGGALDLDLLLAPLLSRLSSGLGGVLGTAINGVLDVAVTNLSNTITALIAPAVNQVAGIFTALNANNILKLVVNAQNHDVVAGPPNFSAEAGRYEVAALWLSVLPAIADGVNVYLGRAWAGQNTEIAA